MINPFETFLAWVRTTSNNEWLALFLTVILIIVATLFLSTIVSVTIKKTLTRDSVNLPSVTIYTNISRIVVWAVGITVLLSTCFGIDVSGIVTALGIGGIAVSLGFKDTLANLISGVQVSTCKIMKPGDHVNVANHSGTVIDTSWRHTTIHAMSGETIIVPNAIINSNAVIKKLPYNNVHVHFLVKCGKRSLAELTQLMISEVRLVAKQYGTIREDVKISYSSIVDGGAKGIVIIKFSKKLSGKQALDIKNAVVVAIAPFVDSVK